MTAPDRPGDRDQQQAAGGYSCYCLPGAARCDDPYNRCDRRDREQQAADRQTAHRVWNEALCNSDVPGWDRLDAIARALAAARAEEAARWRAKIEALAAKREAGWYVSADDIRAMLDET